MINRRFGLLKYLTPFVAAAAFVLNCGARAAETAPTVPSESDGMSWCQVKAGTVHMRMGPNTSTQVFSDLHGGEYIRAKTVQKEKDWLEMEWPKNIPAWVQKSNIATMDGKSGTVRTAKARIMSNGASTAAELAALNRGANVVIVGETGDWYRVQAPSAARAYVSAKFVVIGVQAPQDLANPLQEKKTAGKIQAERTADSVALPQSSRAQQEIDANPADVVVVQRQINFPNASNSIHSDGVKAAVVEIPSKKAAPVAPAVVTVSPDEAMFGPAETSARSKSNDDELVAQTIAAKKKSDQAVAARIAAAERKRADDEELARSTAEARRLEIEKQTNEQVALKKSLEVEIAKLADARKKAEAEETARVASEKKRLDDVEAARVAADARKKADLEEQSRFASERKKLEDSEKEQALVTSRKKVEIETQTQVIAAKKKVLEDELVRLSDAKLKAEVDEKNRIASEKKRLAEAESERIAAESKKAELEEHTQKAAEKKKALEVEIAQLAAAKKKEELDATARAAREKKLIEEAQMSRKEIEARRKSEAEELAKKEAEKKRLDEADAVRSVADAKRLAALADQENAAIGRKKALEADIAKLDAEKQKYEKDAVQRTVSDKRLAEAVELARVTSEKKHAEIVELTKLASEKKRFADEEASRAKLAQEAAQKATEKKQVEELAAQKAVERKRAEEVEIARLATEKKRVAEETARIAGENAKKLEQEKARQESQRKLAELEQARIVEEKKVAAAKSIKLPDLMNEETTAPEIKGVKLVSDRPIMLSESDLKLDKGEPTETNYNSNYVPQSVRDIQKKYVVPKEAPKRVQNVAEVIEVDTPIPTSKKQNSEPMPPPASKPSAPSHSGESVDLPPRAMNIPSAPVVPSGPAVVRVTDSTYAQEIENYKGAVLVDFSATWCGPCQRLKPTIHELAEEFRGRVKVVMIDIDESPNTARRFGANSIPMLMMVKNGRSVETHVGAQPKDYLQGWMQNNADAPNQTPTPTSTGPNVKPKGVGMNLIPTEKRYVVSDVGTLERVGSSDIEGVKYVLRTNGSVGRYVIEPSDVDMSPMVGRTISITGTSIGRTYADVSVIQMKSAATFG